MFAWMDGLMDGWINYNPSKKIYILTKKSVLAGKKVFCLHHHLCTTGVSTPGSYIGGGVNKKKKKIPPLTPLGSPAGSPAEAGGPLRGGHLCIGIAFGYFPSFSF